MSVAINGYVLTVRTLYESGTVNQYHAQDSKEAEDTVGQSKKNHKRTIENEMIRAKII